MVRNRNRIQIKVNEGGFSLLELMVSLALLLIVAGAAFSSLTTYQKSYGSTGMQADLHSSVRSAVELFGQEVGQAGLFPFTPTTMNTAVVVSTAPQTVVVGSTNGMFVGENLLIDTGANQEQVAVTAVGTNAITAVFANNHIASGLSGVMVNAAGVFPQGILSSSTPTSLRLFGDINGDGTLQYVRYSCDTTAGTLTRSMTPLTSQTLNAPIVVASNLVPTPGVTGCFSYPSATSVQGATFIPNVALTISAKTAQKDPQTGQFVVLTKSFVNFTPRNVQAGLDMANAGVTARLQPTPPAVAVLDAQ